LLLLSLLDQVPLNPSHVHHEGRPDHHHTNAVAPAHGQLVIRERSFERTDGRFNRRTQVLTRLMVGGTPLSSQSHIELFLTEAQGAPRVGLVHLAWTAGLERTRLAYPQVEAHSIPLWLPSWEDGEGLALRTGNLMGDTVWVVREIEIGNPQVRRVRRVAAQVARHLRDLLLTQNLIRFWAAEGRIVV